MNSINKTYIRPFVLTLTILGLVIASCTQDDHINGTQEHSEEVEYHPLHTGDRELLELRSALHGRQEELVAGYQKGINYKAISWERARIKKEAGRDIIFVPFKTNKSEGTLTYLNYIRSFKNQKNRNVPPIQLFIYKFDAARNLNIYSLSGRMVAVKKVGENVQDITRHLLKGGDEDFWHLGGELEEVVITAPGGGGDTPPPVWDPCADGLCGGDIAPPTTNPHPDYPDCYYSGGCGGNTDNGSANNSNSDDDDDKIDIDEDLKKKYPCLSKIIEAALKAGVPITDLIQDIFGGDSKPEINFVGRDLNNILQGGDTTVKDYPSTFLITMNTERLDVATDFDIVNTTIHESIHATLFYFFLNGDFESSNTSYADLVEDFTKHRAGFGGDHHPHMTSLVNNIANATYNWAINNGYSTANFSEFDTAQDSRNGLQEYLSKLAWAGLTDTDTFKKLFPEGSLAAKKIKDLINSESLPYENSADPKGKKCSDN